MRQDRELRAMRKVLDALEPLTDEQRAAVLAAVAAHFGLWEIVAQIADARRYA